MTKETFLKELEKNLKDLTQEAKKEELEKYSNLDNYNLDPIVEANKIYQNRGIKKVVTTKIKFLEAFTILVQSFESNDKKKIGKALLFLLYLIFLIIIIKIPFIYARDMIANIFNGVFTNDTIYAIWYFAFEIAYAITAILIFIRLIKNKALELEKKDN